MDRTDRLAARVTGTVITPAGRHAHLYDGLVVRQLEGPPAYDSVTSRYVDVGVWCYCPACGRRVSEIWHYLLHDSTLRGNVVGADWTVGFRLRPCGHYVTSICWHMNPDGHDARAVNRVPPMPPSPPPFAPELHLRPFRPNPSAYSNGAGGRGRVCPLCGSSVTHYGWEKRALKPRRWMARRRWVHKVCPD